MSTPNYAHLASRALDEGTRSSPPPPPPPVNRSAAIAAIERAIAHKARAKRRTRWIVAAASVAAAAAATLGGAHYVGLQRGVAGASADQDRVVVHSVAGAASVIVAGETAAVIGDRPVVPGSRIVTAPTGRLILAFAAGTSAVLEEGGDVTLGGGGAVQKVRLDVGSIDLHAADRPDDPRFLVQTRDAEVEAHGGAVKVAVASSDASCGDGTTTRVSVSEGAAVVRHAGVETRVGEGEQWPAGCASTTRAVAGGSSAGATVFGAVRPPPTPSAASTLGEQNDLFAQAIAARRRGDPGTAVAGFDRFLARYPASPLAESATVERMRVLRSTESAARARRSAGLPGALPERLRSRRGRGHRRRRSMIARRATLPAVATLALLACGTQTWSFGGDAGAGAEASAGCVTDTDCPSSSLHCDPASGQCVACVEDSQCTQPGLPRCDSALQQCVQCGVTGDCTAGQVCEPATHTCLSSCADGGPCPSGTLCNQARGVCVGCTVDADCASATGGPVCDTSDGQCVQCTVDSQCASPRRRCDHADDQCVQCLSGADCDDHVCDLATYTCVDDGDD